MNFRKVFLAILISIPSILIGQPIGNEWISPNQQYWKIKIGENALVRLDSAQLANSGFQVNNIDPRRIQLFYRGVQQPLFVFGEQDGVFNSSDFIEFVGRPNDGALDSLIYTPRSSQPNTYKSLFTDTAVYYLTVGPNNGLRYSTYTQGNNFTNNQVAPFYRHESLLTFRTRYYLGQSLYVGSYRSEYTESEGWFSNQATLTTPQTVQIPSLNYLATGPDAELEVKIHGASASFGTHPFLNHHVQVSMGINASNLSVFADTSYEDYQSVLIQKSIPSGIIRNNTTFRLSVVNDLGVQADNNAIGYIKFTYSRNFLLGNSSLRSFQFQPAPTGSRLSFRQYGNANKTSPIIYNLTSNSRNIPFRQGDSIQLEIAGTVNQQFMLFDSTDAISPALTPVQFISYSPQTNPNYLIITHNDLLIGAQAIANYRQSVAGGSYNVLLVTSNQIADQFFYGQNHPLAIRNFLRYTIQQQTIKPEYLFIIGKGFQNSLLFSGNNMNLNLVPAFGSPASDVLLSGGLNGNQAQVPALSTGRLAAKNNQEVQIYLNKLTQYDNTPRELWMKDVLHLSGSKNIGERNRFNGYLRDFESVLKVEKFGGNFTRLEEIENVPRPTLIKDDVVSELSSGKAMFNYFGHGAATRIIPDIGEPSDHNNAGKFPFMAFYGCAVGDCFSGLSMGEEYIFHPNNGTISWLANSSSGYESFLRELGIALYKQVGDSLYGETIGKQISRALRNYIVPSSELHILHSQQFIYQGCPAIKIYNAPLPDFEILNTDIYINTPALSAESDSFKLNYIVKNIGRAISDTLSIRVERTLPNGISNVIVDTLVFTPHYKDTFSYIFKTKDPSTAGLNKFKIIIDRLNLISETNESNNEAELEIFIPGNGIRLLSPINYGIVGSDSVTLIVQSQNSNLTGLGYIFEIDTLPDFSSIWKQNTSNISGTNISEARFALLNLDSQVYYWRARLDLPIPDGGAWKMSSFSHIPGVNYGWRQASPWQLQNTILDSVTYDSTLAQFNFFPISATLTANIRRYTLSALGIALNGNILNPGVCRNGVVVMDFNQKTLAFNNRYDCNRDRYKVFNTSLPAERDLFVAYLNDSIATGDYVALYTRNAVGFDQWNDTLLAALSTIGSDTSIIGAINDNFHAWVLIGRKGMQAGQALEDTVFSPTPAQDNLAEVSTVITGFGSQGRYISEWIGPAAQWESLIFDIPGDSLAENVVISLETIDSNGVITPITGYTNVTTTTSLQQLNANLYPTIRINAYSKNEGSRKIAQLKSWAILYKGIPEGTIITGISSLVQKDTLAQGDSLRINAYFRNISQERFDSLLVNYELRDESRNIISSGNQRLSPLEIGNQIVFNPVISTSNFLGRVDLSIIFNPNFDQPEQTLSNNFLNTSVTITRDLTKPLLEMAFDGRSIADMEIVSPTPNIEISLQDDNQFLKYNDTTKIKLFLKFPNQSTTERVYFDDEAVTYEIDPTKNSIKVNYKPDFTQDGLYELSVEGTDVSGNPASLQKTGRTFQVINQSLVSNFYNYPNPFSTQTKFVFVITGREIPQYIQIKIFSASGKLVKTVKKHELGDLRIGQNISDFTWDGTDDYGDKLANGVYFYKVEVRDNERLIVDQFQTAGDNLFKNGLGKLVILR